MGFSPDWKKTSHWLCCRDVIKFINLTGSKQSTEKFPVLIIHGENDRLVPSIESHTWKTENFPETARVVTISQADHDIFNSINSHLVTDIIQRAIVDVSNYDTHDTTQTINSLIQVEPELEDFFEAFPFSKNHLVFCPSSQRVIEKKPELSPIAKNDPVIANIEITTYCNLKCQFCARSQLKKNNQHMSLDVFCNTLAVLPNIYKIVLVGLGETLMHPQIEDFIKYAKTLKKKVGLVTNAMLLNRMFSEQLLDAGLDSIAFSIDGFDDKLSSLVRKGTDFDKVIKNIHDFVEIAKFISKNFKSGFFCRINRNCFTLERFD